MLFPSLMLSLFAMTPLQSGLQGRGAEIQIAKAMELGKNSPKAVVNPAKKASEAKIVEPARPVKAVAALKIAVVDWQKILDGSRWIRALEREAQKDLLPHKKKMSDLNAKRAELRQDLSLLTPRTPEYTKAYSKLKIVEYSLQEEQNLVKGFMGLKLQEMTYHFNRTISEKIASYARNNGIHLVLRMNSPANGKNVPLGSKVQEQENNSVLFFSPTIDITKEIVERLDNGMPVEANSEKAGKKGKGSDAASSGKGKNPAPGGKSSNR